MAEFGVHCIVSLQGIWAGMLCGTALQTAILSYIVWPTDWKAEVGDNQSVFFFVNASRGEEERIYNRSGGFVCAGFRRRWRWRESEYGAATGTMKSFLALILIRTTRLSDEDPAKDIAAACIVNSSPVHRLGSDC